MAAGQHGGHEILDDRFLAHDALADLCEQGGACRTEALEQGDVVVRAGLSWCSHCLRVTREERKNDGDSIAVARVTEG
jgi:hypothetical protein